MRELKSSVVEAVHVPTMRDAARCGGCMGAEVESAWGCEVRRG